MISLCKNCLLLFTVISLQPLQAQEAADNLVSGEQVFLTSCATGYCHAPGGGTGGGAARLAARGLDLGYITSTVTYGLHETRMQGFGPVLSAGELQAVISYVAALNGIQTGRTAATAESMPVLSPAAASGKQLLHESLLGFGRCATCHQVEGSGVPVAEPVAIVPATVRELKQLETAKVFTVTMGKESMPALVLNQGAARTLFYDLSSVPPVRRNVDTAGVVITAGNRWRHAPVMGAYTDEELADVLEYLRAVTE